MDNTLDALRNLYIALGGTASNVANLVIIQDLINAIAALITTHGISTLPAVSASDNGKVLTVVSGEWNKAAVPTELPAVTTTDTGILAVEDGEWKVIPMPE